MLRPLTTALLWLAACGSPPSTTPTSAPAEVDSPAESEPPADPTSDPSASASEPAAKSPSAEALASLPHEGPGKAAGEPALPFTLQDQHGKARSLDEFLGHGPVAVVFFRSADW